MTLQELAETKEAFVSPKIAAEILGVSQWGLNVRAKASMENGIGTIGCIRFFFSGRNLKLCKADILSFCGYTGPQ